MKNKKKTQLRSFGYYRTPEQADKALKKVKLAHKGLPLTVIKVNRKKKTQKRYCVGYYKTPTYSGGIKKKAAK